MVASDAKTFLEGCFDRLEKTGWDGSIFLEALADDLRWIATGSSPVSGTYHGKQEYVDKVYKPLDERLATWPKPVVERIIGEEEWAAVQFHSEGGKGKNSVDYNMQYCWLMRVSEGKVREVVGFYDQLKVAELFS
jgi:uncharacterized protein